MEALKVEPVSSRLSLQKASAGDDELSSRPRDVTTDTGGSDVKSLDISESETLHRDSPDSDATDTDPISPSVIHLQPGFSLVANSVVIIRSDYSPCKPKTYTYHFSIVNNTSEPIKLNYQPILHPFQEDSPQSSEALIPDNSHSSESSSDLPLPKFTQCTGPDSQSEKAVKTEPIDYSITMNESGTEMESSHEMGEYPIPGQESDCDDDDDDMESDTEDLQGQNSNPYGGLPSTSFQSQVAVGPSEHHSTDSQVAESTGLDDKFVMKTGNVTEAVCLPQEDTESDGKTSYTRVLAAPSSRLTVATGLPPQGMVQNDVGEEKHLQVASDNHIQGHAVRVAGDLQDPTTPSERPYKCPYCSKSYQKNYILKRHVRLHTNEKPFACKFCSKAFPVSSQLRVHERNHTGEKPYKCEYENCDKSFKQWTGLDFHIKSIHTGKRDHLCDLCGMRFLTNGALKNHAATHGPKTDEKPFECEWCDKTFRTKGSLVIHTRIHTGEKPCKCRHCEQSFTTCSQRADHERLHTGEKPYKCTHCGKAFRRQGPCIQHMIIHTGERPYKCRYCDEKFASKATVYNHEKIHKRDVTKMD